MVAPTPDTTPQPEALIAAEIAERYSRALNTVQKHWIRHPEWPEALPTKRGRWNQYDASEVEQVVHRLFLPTIPAAAGSPDDLLTGEQVAEALGIEYSTLRGYVSRDQFVAPDDRAHGVNRWKRSTVYQEAAKRKRVKSVDR